MADPSAVELRGMCPREIVDMLDAVSLARKIARTELVVQVLQAWADQTMHEASSVMAVSGRNPSSAETSRQIGWPEAPKR